jgi:ribosome recycling factor
MLSELEAEGSGADEVDRAKKKVEELMQDSVKQVDATIAHKEKDILEV